MFSGNMEISLIEWEDLIKRKRKKENLSNDLKN